MIKNDTELRCTQERIGWFQGMLAQIRVTATPEQFPWMAGGYQAEIEKMQQEVMDYLMQHVGQAPPAKAG